MGRKRDKKVEEAEVEDDAPKKKGPVIEKPKYGVPYLAEQLGIEPASVRVALRKSDLEKSGRMWGWDTKKDADGAVAALRSRVDDSSDSDDDDDTEDEPAPKKKKKRGKKSKK